MLDNLPTTYVAMTKALAEISNEQAQEIPGIVTGWLTATKLSAPEEQELLKQAGKRFGGKPALERIITEARRAALGGEPEDGDEDEVTLILSLVHKQGPLFFHHEDRGYVAVEDAEGTCRWTWDIRGKAFKLWLISLYFDETRRGPSSEALSAATNTLEAEAILRPARDHEKREHAGHGQWRCLKNRPKPASKGAARSRACL